MERLDFNQPGWTSAEQQQLHDFWSQRYRQNPPSMSPLNLNDGFPKDRQDVGFFDSAQEISNRQKDGMGYLDAYNATNDAYRVRDASIKKQIEYSNGPDRERLTTLRQAEQASHTASVSHFNTKVAKGEHQDRAQQIAQRDQDQAHRSFATLVESDRAQGHPIADPSRDLNRQPPTRHEQYHWCNRPAEGRHDVPAGQTRTAETARESATWHLDKPQRGAPAYQEGLIPDRLQQQVAQRQAQQYAQGTPATPVSPTAPSTNAPAAGTPTPSAPAPIAGNMPGIQARILAMRQQHGYPAPAAGTPAPSPHTTSPGGASGPTPASPPAGPRAPQGQQGTPAPTVSQAAPTPAIAPTAAPEVANPRAPQPPATPGSPATAAPAPSPSTATPAQPVPTAGPRTPPPAQPPQPSSTSGAAPESPGSTAGPRAPAPEGAGPTAAVAPSRDAAAPQQHKPSDFRR